MTEIEYAVKLNDAELLWLMTRMAEPITGLTEGWVQPQDAHRARVEMAAQKMLGFPSLFGERIWCTVKIVIEKISGSMEIEQEEEPEAGEDKEERVTSGRDAGGLIFEIGHDLDEVVMGLYNKDDALIEVGLHDARRDLEELRQAITEA